MAAVALPDWLDFRPRLFPSCNFAWLRGPQPVLVDSGFGTDFEATLALLPDEPTLVFNTHWHSDHVGGNAGLANRFGCRSLLPSPKARASTLAIPSHSARPGLTSRSTRSMWTG